MSDATLEPTRNMARPVESSDLYRAVWRWHFYAGLFVLPFLVVLAATGALYLFRDEIDALVHADLKRVEAQAVQQLPPAAIVDAALAAYPGTALKYLPPASPAASAEVGIKADAGQKISVFVNPYDGQVLGELSDKGTVMWIVRRIHGLDYFGPIANGAIEIAGGWAILLVGTGIYLWWPRKRTGGVVTVRGTPKRRMFWRDLHAVTGLFVGFFITFLAVTGMPWSIVWGAKVNEWANGNNFGYPAGVRVAVPMSDEHLHHASPTPWSLEQARLPESVPQGAIPITLDQAVAVFDRLGLHAGYAVNIPSTPADVYTGSVYPDDLSQQRVVHLDQYSGQPLIDMSYADYGPLGRSLEWGINVHMGQEFGLANQLLMLGVCAGIVTLSISAAVMWWKRRPSGSLGVPPMPSDRRRFRGVIAILAIGGVIFPLVGASLLVMLVLDWLLNRRLARA
ncbi:PepSY-associated TM helix domain-containing protein [Rhodospirillaceae bacterium SYSU D60014]|uniref:PepSY-associated TM helix domain-containing protein n=1 Tax=Virgifigura deserti TaxID=2268457 RepID=UPI000E6603F3